MSTAAAAPPRLTPFACAALICAHIKSCMAHSGSLRNFQLKTSCRERQKTNRLGLARARAPTRELLWRGMNYSLSPSANSDRARTGDMQPAAYSTLKLQLMRPSAVKSCDLMPFVSAAKAIFALSN